MKPCIAEVKNAYEIVQHETFAPILYIMKYKTLEEAIAMQNDVPQGLSSAIMTQNLREAELFLSHAGSDCGIANVNIGHPVQKLAEHSVEKRNRRRKRIRIGCVEILHEKTNQYN